MRTALLPKAPEQEEGRGKAEGKADPQEARGETHTMLSPQSRLHLLTPRNRAPASAPASFLTLEAATLPIAQKSHSRLSAGYITF